MRWFKHMSHANRDEKLARLRDEHGLEAYGAYWLVLETIAEQMDDSDTASVALHPRTWCRILGKFHTRHARTLLQHLSNIGLTQIELAPNMWAVECPNLLKFRDEYTRKATKKSGHAPDKVAPDTDTEEELKTEDTPGGGAGGSVEPQEQEPPEPTVRPVVIYCADGEMTIQPRDIEPWMQSYSRIDVPAHLQALSDWSRETRQWTKAKAFFATSGALNRKNQEAADQDNYGLPEAEALPDMTDDEIREMLRQQDLQFRRAV